MKKMMLNCKLKEVNDVKINKFNKTRNYTNYE